MNRDDAQVVVYAVHDEVGPLVNAIRTHDLPRIERIIQNVGITHSDVGVFLLCAMLILHCKHVHHDDDDRTSFTTVNVIGLNANLDSDERTLSPHDRTALFTARFVATVWNGDLDTALALFEAPLLSGRHSHAFANVECLIAFADLIVNGQARETP